MKQNSESITPLRKYIAFIYIHEWRELEQLEQESKEVSSWRRSPVVAGDDEEERCPIESGMTGRWPVFAGHDE